MDLSFLRSLRISSGITVSTLKETTLCDVEGGDFAQATELSRSEDPALSEPRNDSIALHLLVFSAQMFTLTR
jgi:hypothetical protein